MALPHLRSGRRTHPDLRPGRRTDVARAGPAPARGTVGADPDVVRGTPLGQALLSVEHLSASYGSLRALDGVDLAVEEGEVVALAGENGAGKSTLVRCIAGDVAPSAGTITLAGRRLGASPRSSVASGVAVVWQDLALCDNLDVAANLLLGRERRPFLESEARSHAHAAGLLAELGIPLADTYRPVASLSGGQRQMVAVARAMRDEPRLLILDEPTAALGVKESAQVEELTRLLRRRGTTILLVSHDIEQLFRLADRIVVLRHGRVVTSVDPALSHPHEVVSLLSGQEVDGSARRQLSRLQGLADRLASADPSSSLSLILSALGAALGTEQVVMHLLEGDRLRAPSSTGLPASLLDAWRSLPLGFDGGPPGVAAASGRIVVDPEVAASPRWAAFGAMAARAGVASSWSVPVLGTAGLLGVITVLGRRLGPPERDELELVGLYAGYAAGVVERDRLLGQLQGRNRLLETIREVLETLAGPVPLGEGLPAALRTLRHGLQADGLALFGVDADGAPTGRATTEAPPGSEDQGNDPAVPAGYVAVVDELLAAGPTDLRPRQLGRHGSHFLAVTLPSTEPTVLVARWQARPPAPDAAVLLEDAANSLRLALEREQTERAEQEAAALRRSRELQRQFLSRLSHELRTPLTAIQGYASSLRQPDVTWDDESEGRFLDRIGAESARVGRLVDDLLDFSAIESGVLRVHPDWCDLALVLEAARTCLRPAEASRVTLTGVADLPSVWADHDRLEQVFVNLLDNAFRHNPDGTTVEVVASVVGSGSGAPAVEVTVTDDGIGLPGLPSSSTDLRGRRSPTAGAGLGLSIAQGIVTAHRGVLALDHPERGTRFRITLPVEGRTAEVGIP